VNQSQLATCQCIIAHPSKAKFLAVKHTGGHLPPTVGIPHEFDIGENIEYVLDGVRRKYGLKTVALRHLARFSDYQCIELEMLGTVSHQLQAVWVGLDDYRRIRGSRQEGFDPLRAWLEEKSRGVAPIQRAPWEQAGWFRKAEHWIDFQLDRLHIQRSGPVVQQRALAPGGVVLRVPTTGEKLFFLAARKWAPKEARLMRFLSDQWPELVIPALADDMEQNWMLVHDFKSQGQVPRSPAELSVAADALARMQLESATLAPQLRDLGCHASGLDRLAEFLASDDLLQDLAANDGEALTEAELGEFSDLLPRLVSLSEKLASYALPSMLVHPDFRSANCVLKDGSVRFVNWGNTSVGHPFISLLRLLNSDHSAAFEALDRDPVVRAYLARFEEFQTRDRLLHALKLAQRLQHAWTLMDRTRQLPLLEPGGVGLAVAKQHRVSVARRLLAANRMEPGQVLAD